MTNVLYFDCFAGAAGDMLLGALVDAGAPPETVIEAVARLDLGSPVRVEFTEVRKAGLRSTKAVVTASTEPAARTLSEIAAIIDQAGLDESVSRKALHVFELLAAAEARVHGTAAEEVTLHEVGMADSIVDVVGCVVALHHFEPGEMFCSPLPLGGGTTTGAHGLLPVPAPAVVELLRGVSVVPGGTHETVTPTGAALLVALCDSFGAPPPMTIHAVGYGAGDRDTEHPNVTRVLVGTAPSRATASDAAEVGGGAAGGTVQTTVMEANLDDLNPEVLPYVIERLIGAGAQDAWVTPVLMKKGRPGFVLSALVRPGDEDRVADVFFSETTTLGVRMHDTTKIALERAWIEVEIEGHPLRVKIARRGGEMVTAAPEYEDAVKVARATGLPLREVYARAETHARSLIGEV